MHDNLPPVSCHTGLPDTMFLPGQPSQQIIHTPSPSPSRSSSRIVDSQSTQLPHITAHVPNDYRTRAASNILRGSSRQRSHLEEILLSALCRRLAADGLASLPTFGAPS